MKLRRATGPGGEAYRHFYCPGCRDTHTVRVAGPTGHVWGFNGDEERPTFTPSLLLTCGHHMSTHRPGDRCWCVFNEERRAAGEESAPFKCYRCHSFVTDGRIQFLSDCSHDLAGQTIDLPDIPDGLFG